MKIKIPRPQLILGYREIHRKEPPTDRLSLVAGFCKRHLIAEFCGLNYRLKPKNRLYHDTSLETQNIELERFCGYDDPLFKKYCAIAERFTRSDKDYPLFFTRQTCLFAIEELIQSDLPVLEHFDMNPPQVWEAILTYILAVNNALTDIKQSDEGEPVNFETLNPKMIPLNELNLDSDPVYITYRGHRLLSYLSQTPQLGAAVEEYFAQQYTMVYEHFIYELLSMYMANDNEEKEFDFSYRVPAESRHLFERLSQVYPSTEFHKLLSIRKYPFYKSDEDWYLVTDNILLVEKAYNQFINDFWFDFLKSKTRPDGAALINIQQYKSMLGMFFETYVKEIINYTFARTKYYVIKCFEQLKIQFKKQEIEIADVYVRFNNRVLLGQVKVTSLYDKEKYSENLDGFYKNNREGFFESFGLNQLVNSLIHLEETIVQVDSAFPVGKAYRVFPAIIVNEKAMQTPLMAKIFQDRFTELLPKLANPKVHIYPLTIMHVSDLERMQDYLYEKPNGLWEILKEHGQLSKFMLPFYDTLNQKDIRANYKRSMALFEELIPKYHKGSAAEEAA